MNRFSHDRGLFLQDPGEVMFIKGSLSAQRFITALDMADKSLTEEVSRQLWMRAWSRVHLPRNFIRGSSIAFLVKAWRYHLSQKIAKPTKLLAPSKHSDQPVHRNEPSSDTL